MDQHKSVVIDPIFGLGLCAGAGGLELALEIAIPGYRPICLVEREASVAGRIAARVQEGSISSLAIWDDVTTFDGQPWRGRIHLISAGFPCQPFSVAGKRQGTADERWIWPDIIRIVSEAFGEPEPGEIQICFFENVPGLLGDPASDVDPFDLELESNDAIGGMGTVLRDLAERDFDAETVCIRASDVGASHGRKRVFILAYRQCSRRDGNERGGILRDRPPLQAARSEHGGRAVEDAGRPDERGTAEPPGLNGRRLAHRSDETLELPGEFVGGRAGGSVSGDLERAEIARRGGGELPTGGESYRAHRDLGIFAPGPADPRWGDVLVQYPWLRPSISQAEIESHFRNVADGLAAMVVNERTGALRALGNGVVPLQAALGFRILLERAGIVIE